MPKIIKKKEKFFAILSFIVCFSLCIALADLFSNVITIKAYNNYTTTGKTTAFSIYALSLHDSTTEATATEYASAVIKQGGAGYVWNNNGVFYVLASAYAEENDAKLVQTNLSNSEITSSIIKLDFSEITITGTFTSLENTTLNDALKSFKTTYDTLYDISIALDTSIKTETESKLAVSQLFSDINKIEIAYNSVFNSQLTSNLLYLKIALSTLTNELQTLTNFKDSATEPYSHKLKSTYITALHLNHELCTNINEIK